MTRRIMYQAAGFQSGLGVTATVYRIDTLEQIGNVSFTEMTAEPVYYADVDFPCYGRYLMVVSHDGVRATSTVIGINSTPGIVRYNV